MRFSLIAWRTSASQTNSTGVEGGAAGSGGVFAPGSDSQLWPPHPCDPLCEPAGAVPRRARKLSTTSAATPATADCRTAGCGGAGVEHPQDGAAAWVGDSGGASAADPPADDAAASDTAMPREAR